MIHWAWLIPAAIVGAFMGIFALAVAQADKDD